MWTFHESSTLKLAQNDERSPALHENTNSLRHIYLGVCRHSNYYVKNTEIIHICEQILLRRYVTKVCLNKIKILKHFKDQQPWII